MYKGLLTTLPIGMHPASHVVSDRGHDADAAARTTPSWFPEKRPAEYSTR